MYLYMWTGVVSVDRLTSSISKGNKLKRKLIEDVRLNELKIKILEKLNYNTH